MLNIACIRGFVIMLPVLRMKMPYEITENSCQTGCSLFIFGETCLLCPAAFGHMIIAAHEIAIMRIPSDKTTENTSNCGISMCSPSTTMLNAGVSQSSSTIRIKN